MPWRLLHYRCEYFLHGQAGSAAGERDLLLAAVCPDGVRDAAERCQAFIVALLVAVVDGDAGENAVAIVLVGTHGAHARIGRREALPAVPRLCEERIGLEAEAG